MAKTFSNRYMLLYSAALVAVAAVLLTLVSVSLKPRQVRNREVEKKQMILKAAGIASTKENAEQLYADNISVGAYPSVRPLRLPVQGVHGGTPLQFYRFDGGIVIPLKGTGLWGPIWGYLALDSTGTVVGAVFDHQGETPGLGGEIATDKFAARFIGKRMDTRAIRLTKNADHNNPYEVDAISGGTMTSNGVTEMLEEAYEDYISVGAYPCVRPKKAYPCVRPKKAYPCVRPKKAYPCVRPKIAYPCVRPAEATADEEAQP